MRSLAQSTFVDENEDTSLPERLFLAPATPSSSTGRDLLFVAIPCSPLRSLRAPAQTHQNLPDMAFVIANVKLLLDQVGHTGTGPQRSLTA
jgi:hypothetical protein